MGHDVNFWGVLKIIDGRLDDVEKIVNDTENEDFFDYSEAEIDKKKMTLQLGGSDRYDENDWNDAAAKLAPYVEGRIEFNDDQDGYWCLDFKDGVVEENSGGIIYGNSYEVFMKEYADKLPEEVVRKLKEWECANKI